MSAPTLPIQVWPLIKKALADEALRSRAGVLFAEQAKNLFAEKAARRDIHASDCGRCVLELAEGIEGNLEPFDPQTMLFKLDDGTLHGAWCAALFKVGLEASFPGWSVALEVPCAFADSAEPSHADAIVSDPQGVERQVIDFKRTAWVSKDGPGEHQRLQVNGYAIPRNIEHSSLVTLGTNGKSEPVQTDMLAADWVSAVHEEALRLARARTAFATCDGDGWRATYCKLAACPKRAKAIAS